MDALAKACEVARESLVLLPSESSTKSSGRNPQAEIVEKRIDFIVVGSDDVCILKLIRRGSRLGRLVISLKNISIRDGSQEK